MTDTPKTDPATAVAVWRSGPEVFPFLKGRIALYAILRAAGVGPGDEVLVPGFTCVVVPAAIQYAGARPVFYEIDPATYNGNPGRAAEAIGPRTRAVIVQHSFGMPMDPGGLPGLCRDRGLLLIEDAAHAMGASLGGTPVGILGDAAFASFQWSKPVTTGLGGLARVNDAETRRSLAELYTHDFREPSRIKSSTLAFLSAAYNRFYRAGLYWRARDFYHRLSSLGLVQGSSSEAELIDPAMPNGYRERFGRPRRGQIVSALDQLPEVIAHRRSIAALYADAFRAAGRPIQQGPEGAESIWLRFPTEVDDRERVLEEARRRRIELGDWFCAPLHPAVPNPGAFGYRAGLCPEADRISARIVNLPTHTGIDAAEASRILEFVTGL